MNKKFKILIAIGGTGGHVFPGCHLAQHLIEKKFDVELVTDKRGVKFLKNYQFLKISVLPAYPIKTQNIFSYLFSLILIFFSPPLTMSLYETTIFTFKSAPALGLDEVLPPPKKDSKDATDRSEKLLEEIIPKDRKKTYEMREIIKMVVDDKDFFEMSNFFGRGIITGFARLNGFSVGIFANDSNFYAGSMTADNAKKTTRFIKLCNQFNIPILTIVDEPGFLIGKKAEEDATILYGTEAVLAAADSSIPWCTLMVRKSFGVAAAAHFGEDPYVLAWPSSEAGALPLEGGVAVAFGKEIAKAKDPEKKRKEIEEKLAKSQSPFPRAEAFSVHEIIDPKDTRQYLCSWITRVQKSLEVKLLDK